MCSRQSVTPRANKASFPWPMVPSLSSDLSVVVVEASRQQQQLQARWSFVSSDRPKQKQNPHVVWQGNGIECACDRSICASPPDEDHRWRREAGSLALVALSGRCKSRARLIADQVTQSYYSHITAHTHDRLALLLPPTHPQSIQSTIDREGRRRGKARQDGGAARAGGQRGGGHLAGGLDAVGGAAAAPAGGWVGE